MHCIVLIQSCFLQKLLCEAGGTEGYASAVVAASVGLAALPFLAPLLEVYLFSRGSAGKIEETVRIRQSLQVDLPFAFVAFFRCLACKPNLASELSGPSSFETKLCFEYKKDICIH